MDTGTLGIGVVLLIAATISLMRHKFNSPKK